MAEVTAFRNNALPYPVYGAPWTIVFPLLDADGDPVTGATCDSEISKNGDTGTDCTNEGTEIAFDTATNKGMYYLTLTATEETADIVAITVYSATSKATPIVLYPRKLVPLRSGTSQGGAAGYITLDANAGTKDDKWNGCLCVATIDGNVESRIIDDYDGTNQQASVTPDWNVVPDADDTFIVYLPEGMQIPTADAIAINSNVTAAANAARTADGSTTYAEATGDGDATTFDTDLTEETNDHYNGSIIAFVSGNLAGQSRAIEDYDGTDKSIKVDPAFTEEPGNGDGFNIHPGVGALRPTIPGRTLGVDANDSVTVGAFDEDAKAEIESEVEDGLSDYGAATATNITTAHSTTDGKINTIDGIVDDLKASQIILKTTIESANREKTTLQMAAGVADDDQYIGLTAVFQDTGNSWYAKPITDYASSNNVITWADETKEVPKDGGAIYILATASAPMRGTDNANTTVPDAAGVVATALGDGTVILHSAYNAAKTAAQASDVTTAHSTTDALILDAAGIRAAVGMASANLDTQLGTLSTHDAAAVKTAIEAGGSSIAQILADTNELQVDDIPGTLATIAGYLDTEIAAIKAVTDALTAAAAAKLALAAAGIVTGEAEAGTLSTTQMTTNLSEETSDHYIGAVIVWTSGALAGQRTDITDSVGANGLLTFTEVTEEASAGDKFVIL